MSISGKYDSSRIQPAPLPIFVPESIFGGKNFIVAQVDKATGFVVVQVFPTFRTL